jgi:hypothetical protein
MQSFDREGTWIPFCSNLIQLPKNTNWRSATQQHWSVAELQCVLELLQGFQAKLFTPTLSFLLTNIHTNVFLFKEIYSL